MKKIKIAFVIDKIGFFDLCSIPILSSLVKRDGHDAELIEFGLNSKKAIKKLISYHPDIIMYSICSNQAKRYLEINQILKKKINFFSLFGGPHPTFFPSFIEERGVDAICRGEADVTFPQFLKNFGKDATYKTKNFLFKKDNQIIENPLENLVENLDSLPFPDRDIIYSNSYFLANTPIKTFSAGRGCPFNCSYCFNHVFNTMYIGNGEILRTKSVDYLIKEIKKVKEKYPLKFIKFHDDIFGLNKEWLRDFSDKYPKEIGLPFLCYLRPSIVTEDYCRELKKAGCYSICIAIECGNEKIRREILNRNITDEQIVNAVGILRKFKIKIYTLNIVGLPTETYEDMIKTIRINQRVKTDFADVSIFQPYPGTRITEYCLKHGYLNEGNENFVSQFSYSVLNLPKEFKEKIYITHRIFSIIVNYPKAEFLLPLLFKIRNFPFVMKILNYMSWLYYGKNVHQKIYASKIPINIGIRGVFMLLLSKNRT